MTITFSEIAPAAVVVSIIVGALFWLWNRIYRVEVDAAGKLDGLRADFQSYKLHVAETYVPNIAMRDMKDEIMGAVKDLKTDIKGSLGHMGDRLDHMGDRIDRLSQEPPKTKRTTSRLGE